MKQNPDEIRKLAIKLFEAHQKKKRVQGRGIWGNDGNREWTDLPSESVDVWDAVAIEAYKRLRIPPTMKPIRR